MRLFGTGAHRVRLAHVISYKARQQVSSCIGTQKHELTIVDLDWKTEHVHNCFNKLEILCKAMQSWLAGSGVPEILSGIHMTRQAKVCKTEVFQI